MRKHLDRFLQQHQVDAVIVMGGTTDNPHMRYFAPRGRLSHALVLKRQGQAPKAWVSPMEREEAAQSDLTVHTWTEAGWSRWLQEAEGNRTRAWALMLVHILEREGLDQARVAVVGKVELGSHWSLLHEVQRRLPRLTLLGQEGHHALLQARATKDPDEIQRIRRMGRITVEVVGRLWEWLASRRLVDGRLVDGDRPVTIGRVKRLLRQWLLDLGATTPYGIIFAQGRDAGIPHSMGREDEPLEAGRTIVFDIFPQEEGSGYFFDFTRTWALGHASEEAQRLYEQVLEAHRLGMAHIRAGVACQDPYHRVCDYLEARGHPTLRSHPDTQVGFAHSLGHGLGLDIHEAPTLRNGVTQPLEPGMVVTVEPGLYYPEQGMGFRVEDTVLVREDGAAEPLADFPYDFVLPVRG